MPKFSQSCPTCWIIVFLILSGLNSCFAGTIVNGSTTSINPFQGDERMEAPKSFAFHDKSMLDFLADLEGADKGKCNEGCEFHFGDACGQRNKCPYDGE